jgi:hypothetical protein
MAEPERRQYGPLPQGARRTSFGGNLSGFLRQARQGSTFALVMSHDDAWPKCVRRREQAAPPTPGLCAARSESAPDFDTLPTDVLAAMEGEEE